MSWAEKQLAKHKVRKQIEEIMNSPEYKKIRQEEETAAVLNALGRFAFFACGYLETRHGYKKVGLKKFLKYLITCIECTEDDENFFLDYEKYYKDELDLDVLKELGLEIEKSGDGKEND